MNILFKLVYWILAGISASVVATVGLVAFPVILGVFVVGYIVLGIYTSVKGGN